MCAMPEVTRKPPPRDWATRIQIHGILLKKPFGHQSNRWTKRFCLVKDGFLMYYSDGERKEFEKREYFNIHPKGIIPLGECHIEAVREPNHPFCLKIYSSEIDGELLLSSATEHERDNWMGIMERSRRVTWQNTHLSDEMIRQLENDGLSMAREKQDYFDRLQSEVRALSEERIRADELEKINHELEKEKKKLESFMMEMQEEYDKIRGELDETNQQMMEAEQTKEALNQILQQQNTSLMHLTADKEKVLKELQEREEMTSQLTQEKRHLSETTEELRQHLMEIEQQTLKVKQETEQAKEKIKENREKLLQLEEEKSAISEHAQDLQSTIQDLKAQKEMTEKELMEEIRARLSAEEQLREAEMSLKRLERAVHNQTPNIEADVKEEMTVSVNKLRQFFEDLATESKIASDKPLIMRNRLTTRKTIARRARTIRYEHRRQSSSLSEDDTELRATAYFEDEGRKRSQLRRAVTSVQHDYNSSSHLPAAPMDRIVFDEKF